MIGGKKIEAKDGIAIGGDVENSLLVNGDVAIFNLTQATAEAKTLRAEAEPRRLDWEHTDARYDTYGSFQSGGGFGQVETHTALKDWLRHEYAPPVFALLGEYGMGKTLECQRLYCALRETWVTAHPPAWMLKPIYFDLRKSPQFRDAERRGTMALPSAQSMIEQLINRDWVASEGARLPSYDDIKSWLVQGALLIVDGLDECLVHLVGVQHADFLSIWVDLVADAAEVARRRGNRSPRLLVSCRTEFFRNMADQRALFRVFEQAGNARTGCREFLLSSLSVDQIYRYIRAKCPDLHESDVRTLIDSTHNLGELSQRPITLKLLAEKLPKLLAMRQRVGTVNAAALYGMVVDDALARKDDHRHHLHPEHKRELLSALAAHLWLSGTRTMLYEELQGWLHSWLQGLRMRDAKAEHEYRDMRSERIEEDLRTATLVVRTDLLAKESWKKDKEAEGFCFAHSSFAEYFLAVYLSDALRDNCPDSWATHIPSTQTLDFLAQQLELEQASLLKSGRQEGGLSATLSAWAKFYRPKVSELLLKYALHTLTVKVALPVLPNLRGADFSGAQLRGWRFGARLQAANAPLLDFSNIRWSGADLRDCDFAHLRLDDGDFRGARLDLSAFQHCSAQRCDWRQSSLLSTAFRHCRLDGSRWQPLRQCHFPKFVACAGAELLLGATYPPSWLPPTSTHRVEGAVVLSDPLPRMRAVISSRDSVVLSLALSADGSRLVSGLDDGTVRVWDVLSGESLCELCGQSDSALSVKISADGDRVTSASSDGTVLVWDVMSRKRLRELYRPTAWVSCVAVSTDGGCVMWGFDDGTVRVWGTANSECVRELRGTGSKVVSIALSDDGSCGAWGLDDGTVEIWHPSSRECVRRLQGQVGPVRSIAICADGSRVVSGSSIGAVLVWDTLSGEMIRELCGHAAWKWSVAMSANGACVVSGASDGIVRVWDSLSGESMCELHAQGGPVRIVAMSADGGRVASSSEEGAILVWDLSNAENERKLCGDTAWVRTVGMSADGLYVVSGSEDGAIRIWDALTGKTVGGLCEMGSPLQSVAINTDGGYVVSGFRDGTVHLLDISSGNKAFNLSGHKDSVSSVAISSDGGLIASGSKEGVVRIWNASSGEIVRELRGQWGAVRSVAMSASGDRAVWGSSDGTVRVWDASRVECVRQLRGHTRAARCVAMSADGRLVVFGSFDGTACVWDASSGEFVRELCGHSTVVCSVACSANGVRVVSGSSDGTVRVWDVVSGDCVGEVRLQGSRVLSVALSEDGGRVVLGASDGTVRCFAGPDGRAATAEDLQCVWIAAVGSPHGIPSHASWRPGRFNRLAGGSSGPSVSNTADAVELGAEAPPTNTGADPATDTGDVLISASGDAWRFLSWDVEDPTEPSGWRRVPLQGYE